MNFWVESAVDHKDPNKTSRWLRLKGSGNYLPIKKHPALGFYAEIPGGSRCHHKTLTGLLRWAQDLHDCGIPFGMGEG